MVKEIERTGLPVVHMCTVVPISLTVGANRIVPTVAIPHPLGNPALSRDEEKKLRMVTVVEGRPAACMVYPPEINPPKRKATTTIAHGFNLASQAIMIAV
jgi:betaine reductase